MIPVCFLTYLGSFDGNWCWWYVGGTGKWFAIILEGGGSTCSVNGSLGGSAVMRLKRVCSRSLGDVQMLLGRIILLICLINVGELAVA